MYWVLSVVFDLISAGAVLLLLFVVLQIFYIKDIRKTAVYFVFAVYLSGVLSVVGVPDVKSLTVDVGVNVIPFVDMISDIKNAVLNVVLFLPLGFLLPIIWKKFREFKYTLLFGFGMTMTIEILQIFTYRLTDVNDLITNTAGTVAGYFIARKIVDKTDRFAPDGDTRDVFIITALVFLVMFIAVPFISSALWDTVL